MKNKLLSASVFVVLLVLVLGIDAAKKEVRTSQMLMDDEVKPLVKGKALLEVSKPQPFPAEPYPLAKVGELNSSTMLIDLEELARKEKLPLPGKEVRPVSLPEEPKLTEKKKK